MPQFEAIILSDCRGGGKNLKRGDKFKWDSNNKEEVRVLKDLVAANRLIVPSDLPETIEPGSEYDGLRKPSEEPAKVKK
jgi:hypothetical protein